MRRPVVYISGPITDGNAIGVANNLHRFQNWELLLLRSGYAPINPGADWNLLVHAGDITREELMERDEAHVAVSDAVLQIDGWEYSNGAQAEAGFALNYRVPLVGSIIDLHEIFPIGEDKPDWVDSLPNDPDS